MACMGYGNQRYPGTVTLGQSVDFSPAGTLMGNVADSKQAAHVNDHITLSPDKEYGAADTRNTLKVTKAAAHVAQNICGPKSAVKRRVAKSEGYAILQKKSKRIVEENSRAEFIGPYRRATVRGIEKADQLLLLQPGVYNLAPMQSLGQNRLQTA